MSIFEQASKSKLRFDTIRGGVSVEDLWDLSLTDNKMSLDSIAISLSKEIKNNDTESFVVKKVKTNSILELKFDIVKHIIEVKLADIEASENEALRKIKKEQIMGIISDKEDDTLKGKSVKDLKKMLDSL